MGFMCFAVVQFSLSFVSWDFVDSLLYTLIDSFINNIHWDFFYGLYLFDGENWESLQKWNNNNCGGKDPNLYTGP